MKKGVIFTIDAIVALGIFLSSLFLFSSFFVDTTFSGMAGTNIYAQSEKTLATLEKDENYFFDVYTNYIHNSSNEDIINNMSHLGIYPSNLRFYIIDNNQKELIASSVKYSFEQKLVFRRFVVYQNATNIELLGNITKILIESGLPNGNLTANATVKNPGPENWTDVNVSAWVLNEGWKVLNFSSSSNLNVGESKDFNFLVEVPEDAIANNYMLMANLTYNTSSGQRSETYYKSFHVIKYGMVEMEVGLE